ncbi:MAG: SDR family oxidoreductase [Chlorobium sp.]|nr:SDR family oxidoreductase [Chlorobium phaeovibrioides]NQU45698.1 SDR family oxidoreductase [Chlorobium sp.]
MITVVITGSSKGIGFGLAKAFLAAGCNVTVSCHDAEGLRAAETELTAAGFGERCLFVLCDVVLVDDVESLWRKSAAKFDRIDIWINNAASAHRMVPLWKLDHDEIAGTVDVNVTGTLNGSYVAMRNMIVQGGGHIYNMDGMGLDGSILEGMGIFGAANAAVSCVSRSLIEDARNTTVKVSTIVPGLIRTALQADTIGATTQGRVLLAMFGEDVLSATADMAARILRNRTHGSCINRMTPPDMIGKVVGAPLRMLLRRKG